ncbi:MAG: flagellar protein FlgN [Moorella sp. (in: firmicutes)]
MRELAEILRVELEAVRDLLAVCRREQEALVADDIEALRAAVEKKGELARMLAALEEERQQAVRQQTAVSDAAPAEGEELRGLLRHAVRELQEVNETNRLLARQSLAYARKVLSLLLPEDQAPALMDRRV